MVIAKILSAFRQWTGKSKSDRLQVLMIDDWIPNPSIGAGAPRAVQMLRALIESGSAVTHFSTMASPAAHAPINWSIPDVIFHPKSGARPASLRKFLKRSRDRFDVILISRPHNMSAFNVAQSGNSKIARTPLVIYDAEAIFSERDILQKAIARQPFSATASQTMIDTEIDLATNADAVLTVNDRNAALFRNAGHANVRVLRHAVAGHFGQQPHGERESILFVGPTYSDDSPNTDSVVWFVETVLPVMRRDRNKMFCLTLVGRTTASAITSLPRDSIDVRGPIQNLDGEYARAVVFVAPTRFAAGIPLKVYEAASHGVPCVITPLLAEQLDWRDGEEVLVADTPELFARQCLRLIDDSALWERLRVAAYDRTLRDCDWSTFKTTVQSILPGSALPQSSSRRAQHLSDS